MLKRTDPVRTGCRGSVDEENLNCNRLTVTIPTFKDFRGQKVVHAPEEKLVCEWTGGCSSLGPMLSGDTKRIPIASIINTQGNTQRFKII